MKLSRPTGLVWRLYAVGIIQLALVVVAVIVIGIFVVRRPALGDFQNIAQHLQPLVGQGPALERALTGYREQHVLLSIYDAQQTLVASNVQPPLPYPELGAYREPGKAVPDGPAPGMHASPEGPPRPPHGPFRRYGWQPRFLPPPPGLGPHHLPRIHTYTPLQVSGELGVLVASLEPPAPGVWPPALTLLAGLLVVFVGAMLTARWIARPLEQLSRAARALGRGDLDTRTDLKRADELGEVGRTFNEMASRIQELLLSEKELLANVAHELRTPLARIRVALEIASESDAETVRASLAEIAVDLVELETLIDDVLTATRFEIGSGRTSKPGLALHIEEISPLTVAERALERFRTRHPKRAVSLESTAALPLIEVDPMLFRRVLDNLLENADKYSPNLDQTIQMSVASSDANVIFEVVDHGLGIPDDDLPRIFSPFFRGEPSRSRQTGGVGLGLTLAKRIVEAHGGTISLSSRQGAGTSVRAALPVPKHAVRVSSAEVARSGDSSPS